MTATVDGEWKDAREKIARRADEALRAWAEAQGIDARQLSLKPEELGVPIAYLASGPESAPECDFAVPIA